MSLPPEVGTPVVQTVSLYWSIKYMTPTLLTYTLESNEYIPLALEVPIELIVTHDALTGCIQGIEAARADAHAQFAKRIAELDQLKSRYLALEMSPAQE